MDLERFGDDAAHGHPWIERSVGVLKDHLHAAAHATQRLSANCGEVNPLKHDLAFGRPIQLQDGPGHGGFAAATFAHQAQGLAATQGKAQSVDSANNAHPSLQQGAPHDGKVHLEVPHVQQNVLGDVRMAGHRWQRRHDAPAAARSSASSATSTWHAAQWSGPT